MSDSSVWFQSDRYFGGHRVYSVLVSVNIDTVMCTKFGVCSSLLHIQSKYVMNRMKEALCL